MIKTAIIMAAGTGTRFGEHTKEMPKGFIEVGGTPMVVRSIEMLISCGIDRIIIGTGYLNSAYEELKSIYPQIETYFNPRYAQTNSMSTLYNSRNLVREGEDFLLLESDIIFDKRSVNQMLESTFKDAFLVAELTKFQDQYFVEYNDKKEVIKCSTDSSTLNVCGEFVGITKVSNLFFKKLCNYYATAIEELPKLGYEFGFLEISKTVMPIYAHKGIDINWYEIDDEADLKYAEKNIVKHCK